MSIEEETLVTGATGLVGSCIRAKHRLSSQNDLREKDVAESLFCQLSPRYVVHCAAKVGGLGANMSKKGEFFYDNIMMNTNVLEAARKAGVEKLVAFLSTCVFPDVVEYPLDATKIHQGEPHVSNYPYAYAKRMLDVQIRAYREQYEVNYTSVIPTNIYGPRDNFSVTDGHVIPALIHKCYLARERGTAFEVWGTGSPLREFIYSEDVGQITEWILKNYDGEDPIIISTSQETSIRDIVDIIVSALNFKGKVVWRKEKPDGQFRKPSDNTLLTSLLLEFSFTPIDEGIEKTTRWFEENYEILRR